MIKIKAINIDGVLHPEKPFPPTMTRAVCDGEYYIVFEGELRDSIPAPDSGVFLDMPDEIAITVVEKKTLWQKIKSFFGGSK